MFYVFGLIKRFVIFFYLFQIFSCHSGHKTLKETIPEKKTKNVFGLYSYYVTGNRWHCETIKHSLTLNNDSTFVLKIYCYADSTSLLKPTVKLGKWHFDDSLLHFVCSDSTKFDGEIFDDDFITLISHLKEEKDTYPFRRDTTKDEMFWQRHSK